MISITNQELNCQSISTEVKNEFWSYGEYELVGHGKQTSHKCGTFNKYMGCLNYKHTIKLASLTRA